MLARQVDLFRNALEEGVPIEEAVGVLSLGNFVNFEFSVDSVGDVLGILGETSESE